MSLFLHMPKCAGSSVLSLLQASVPDRLQTDYGASFFKLPPTERAAAIQASLAEPQAVAPGKLIYGHFFPVKYLGAGAAGGLELVTILRDPLDRLRSHYRFWNSGDYSDHYLWRRMKAERWSYRDFAFSEPMRNFYAQYLVHTPLERFTYIGLFEDLEPSIARCLDALRIPRPRSLGTPHKNATPAGIEAELSTADTASLRQRHAEDYRIYAAARKAFHS